MEMILAKSNGVSLYQHSINVGVVAKYLGKRVLLDGYDELIKVIYYAGMLHDIGKASSEFQKMLLSKSLKPFKSNNKYRHNEIGWAFLYQNFNFDEMSSIAVDLILNSVYWHHGISNKLNGYEVSEVITKLSEDEINDMKSIVVKLLGEDYVKQEPNNDEKNAPLFYISENENTRQYNQKFGIVRSCVISADRIVSELEDSDSMLVISDDNVVEVVGDLINGIDDKNTIINSFNESPYKPSNRFNTQRGIVDLCDKTTIINAPAGFGKTMVGILWSLINNRKTIWVCPRNVVAESVYESILCELTALNLNQVNVELYLSGVRMNSNHNNHGEFNSDIIVTNIDNYLTPSIDDRTANRLYTIYTSNVIFDEYHELKVDSPLLACFINIMRGRHRNTSSRTLLLSATPIEIKHEWDSINSKTKMLPNEYEHYPAAHSVKYNIQIQNGLKYNGGGSNLIIFNSIREAQKCKRFSKNDMVLFHNLFTTEEKNSKLKWLMSEYEKNSQRVLNKKSVIGTLIMQASLDVSFHNLYESVQSPEASLRRIGRCNRFGDYSDSTITFFKHVVDGSYSRSEKQTNSMFYDSSLTDSWFTELSKHNEESLTLDELYVIYNAHCKSESKRRKKFHEDVHRESKKALADIYPIRYDFKGSKSEVITAGGNKLRSNGNEIFTIVANGDGSYVGPFSTKIYSTIDKDFNEKGNVLLRMLGSMKTIMKSDVYCNKYDYSFVLDNKPTIDEVRRLAKKSNTPYIRYDCRYDDELGIIKEDNNEINEF